MTSLRSTSLPSSSSSSLFSFGGLLLGMMILSFLATVAVAATATTSGVVVIEDTMGVVPNLQTITDELRHRILSYTHEYRQQQTSSSSSSFAQHPILKRLLQETEGGGGGAVFETQCISDTMVVFDDDFSANVFGTNYSAICSCSQDDNIMEILIPLGEAPNATIATIEEINAYVTAFNMALSALQISTLYDCSSGCAVCFENNDAGICGFMTSYEQTYIRGKEANITWDDIQNGLMNVNPTSLVSETNYTTESCLTYVTGSTGTLCFGVDFASTNISDIVSEQLENPTSLPICAIEYNDVPCLSCTAQSYASNDVLGCYIADCTNIDPAASINSCTQTGFVGPFTFLQTFAVLENTTFTQGTCDVTDIPPPSASTSAPVSTTTLAPMAMTTISDSPSLAPFAADQTFPTPTPNDTTSTMSPVASPPTPPTSNGTAPISPPVRAPTVSPPTSQESPRSSSIPIVVSWKQIVVSTTSTISFLLMVVWMM